MSKPAASLEAVVLALASQCDGARVKDGRGYSKADAQEGARLSALVSSGIPWSVSDAKRAQEMAARHPEQAAAIMSGGNERFQRALASALREGKLPSSSAVEDSKQPKYNLASLSSGGRNVNFWRMSWVGELSGFLSRIHGISKMRHGQRRINVAENKGAEATINGQRRRIQRWEVPFNGTSLPEILAVARDYCFALDPAVEAGPDPVIDALRRSARACWLQKDRAGRDAATVAVFDLERADKEFAAAVKKDFRGKFSCSPADDWNWTIDWNPETRTSVTVLARRFGFEIDPSMSQ